MWMMTITTAIVILADKALPNATSGNCWTYALPKWYRHGGYLLVRNADIVRFLWIFPVPHVAWVKHLGSDVVVEQFDPVKRKLSKFFPWFTIYYEGKVKLRESNHDAT